MKHLKQSIRPLLILFVLACVSIPVSCADFGTRNKPAPVPEIMPGVLKGYLQKDELPNSLALIPAPPAEGSAAFALDEEVARNSVALRDSRRWKLAILDADLSFPNAAKTFSCALGVPITEEGTPHLYMLLRRTIADAGLSTYTAKNHYKRARPFMVNHEPVCTPEDLEKLEKDGSYPSGHTAVGWAWALILAEIAPDRADDILLRGRVFGESRNICNVHWHSDVVQGRTMGAAAVAKLHSIPEFLKDLEGAKAEVAALKAGNTKLPEGCSEEAEILGR